MLVIDVQGFYAPQIQATVNLDGTLGDHTSRVVSSSRPATGQYTVTVDRNVSGCVASANVPLPGGKAWRSSVSALARTEHGARSTGAIADAEATGAASGAGGAVGFEHATRRSVNARCERVMDTPQISQALREISQETGKPESRNIFPSNVASCHGPSTSDRTWKVRGRTPTSGDENFSFPSFRFPVKTLDQYVSKWSRPSAFSFSRSAVQSRPCSLHTSASAWTTPSSMPFTPHT